MKRVFYWGTSAYYGFDNSSMTLIKNVVYKKKKLTTFNYQNNKYILWKNKLFSILTKHQISKHGL